MTIRIVLHVDIPADTPQDAYRKLSEGMSTSKFSEYWESTDEWYDADGDPVSVYDINNARMVVLKEREEGFIK